MINGTHLVIYSKNAEADRVFFRDTLGFASVDVGRGWLVFLCKQPSQVSIQPKTTTGTKSTSCAMI